MICKICGLETGTDYQHANPGRCIAELRAALFRTQLEAAAAVQLIAGTRQPGDPVAHHPV